MENGQFTGSFAPYGYLIDENDKNHLVVDEEASFVVKKIFDWYIQGWGYRKIVLELNNLNIPSPTAHKQQLNSNYININESKSYSKGLWTNTTIYTIIRNEVYIGTLVQNKSHNISYKNKKRIKVDKEDWIRVPNCHEAIIDTETWNKAQEKIKSRVRASKITQEVSMLSGKVKCAICGKCMKRNTYYNKKRTIKYYNLTCATYKIGAMNCPNKSGISGLKLEGIILEQLNGLISEYCQFDKIDIEMENNNKIKILNTTLAQYEKKINILNERCSHLYEDKLDGVITKEQYIAFSKKYNNEITEYTEKYNDIENQIKKLKINSDSLKVKQEMLKKYSNITELTKPLIDEFIDTIEIGIKDENGEREIKINWNF